MTAEANLMNRLDAIEAIEAQFPDVKVLLLADRFEHDGLGVELVNRFGETKRNAVLVNGDDWTAAADMLVGWLRSIAEPADASTSGAH